MRLRKKVSTTNILNQAILDWTNPQIKICTNINKNQTWKKNFWNKHTKILGDYQCLELMETTAKQAKSVNNLIQHKCVATEIITKYKFMMTLTIITMLTSKKDIGVIFKH